VTSTLPASAAGVGIVIREDGEPHTKAQLVEESAKAVEAPVALVLVWK
jgi:hypothetical protein